MSIVNVRAVPRGRGKTDALLTICDAVKELSARRTRANGPRPSSIDRGRKPTSNQMGCNSCLRCPPKAGIGRKLGHCKAQTGTVNRILGKFRSSGYLLLRKVPGENHCDHCPGLSEDPHLQPLQTFPPRCSSRSEISSDSAQVSAEHGCTARQASGIEGITAE